MAWSQFIALHIPDGFLSLPVALVGWFLMLILVGLALQKTRDQLGERQIPMLGVLAAFVFAAQMINFPVLGGTSGHLLGGVLVAILLRPWAAILVMTTVVMVQAILFQDGGLLAMGFNVVNMGILTVVVGYAIYTGWRQYVPSQFELFGAAFAAWVSVELAAAATSLQLVFSGTASLGVVLPAMLGVHALIGLGEAAITVAVLSFIQQTRPDLLAKSSSPTENSYAWVAAGLVLAVMIAFASPLASSHPDGLERVAEDQSFLDQAQVAPYEILPDYTVPNIPNETITTILAGVIGVLVVAGISYAVGRQTASAPTSES